MIHKPKTLCCVCFAIVALLLGGALTPLRPGRADNTITLPQFLVSSPGVLRESFDTLSGWTVEGSGAGYSATVDTSHVREGSASIRLTTPSGSGNVAITKAVAWDLSAAEEQGNLRFWVYVGGATAPSDFQVHLANDAGFQNYFRVSYHTPIEFVYRPGWNLVNIHNADWQIGSGAPTWSNPIVQARFRIYNNTAATFSLDGLSSGVVAVPAVAFTFDDALSSFYSQAFAFMRPRNVRGTGYIITDWVEDGAMAPGRTPLQALYGDDAGAVTWSQLLEMYGAGWTIGNHTDSHVDLTGLSLSGQMDALLGAREALNDHGMTNVDYVSYPFGLYDGDTLAAMANLGMRNGRTTRTFNNLSPLASPYELGQRYVNRGTALSTVQGWVSSAIARQEVLVLTFHDIETAPSEDGWYIDRFQSLVDYCIQQGIPFLTMDDLYRLQTGSITIPATSSPATRTPTPTRTRTPTPSRTPTMALTLTVTSTRTVTQTPSRMPTMTATATSTQTITPTPSRTPTMTATATSTRTVTSTPSRTPTVTATATSTRTGTPTPSQTPTVTPTMTATNTRTVTPSPTVTPNPTNTRTVTPTQSSTPTMTETETLPPTDTPTPTESSTPTASNTPLPMETASPTSTKVFEGYYYLPLIKKATVMR